MEALFCKAKHVHVCVLQDGITFDMLMVWYYQLVLSAYWSTIEEFYQPNQPNQPNIIGLANDISHIPDWL